MLKRSDVVKTNPIVGEPYFVKKFNDTVCIKNWSGKQRASFLSYMLGMQGYSEISEITNDSISSDISIDKIPLLAEMKAKIVCDTLCQEDGTLVFDSTNRIDVEEILYMPDIELEEVFNECLNRNGMKSETLKKEIKNSETTQNEDSTCV